MSDLYDYEIGEEFDATGTAETTAASKTVSGTGTAFTSEFDSGYLITVSEETRVVDTVTNDTTLTVTENFTTGSGGAVSFTGVNLINLEALTTAVYPPKSSFQEYAEFAELGDGTVRGLGWSIGEWRWGYLTQAMRNQLREFCTGASNSVYIRSRENDDSDSYQYYDAVIVWPTGQEDKLAGKRRDFVLRIVKAVEVEVS